MPNAANIQSPVLVVGPGRSGSSWLMALLGQHAHCQSLPENTILDALHRELRQGWWVSASNNTEAVDFQSQDWERQTVEAARHTFLQLFPGTQRHWAMKVLWHDHPWPFIKAVFPKARLIHLVRDPVGSIRSMMTAFSPDSTEWLDPTFCEHRYTASHEEILGLDRSEWQYLRIDYAAIRSDPKGTLAEILKFCRIPADKALDAGIKVNVAPAPSRDAAPLLADIRWGALSASCRELAARLGFEPPADAVGAGAVAPAATAPRLGATRVPIRAALEAVPEAYRRAVGAAETVIDGFIAAGLFQPSDIAGKIVIDWEAGSGDKAVALLKQGAAHVYAIDSWLQSGRIPPDLLLRSDITFVKASIREFVALHPELKGRAGLIFANTVTEHLSDLLGSFRICRDLLADGGLLFSNHDNYYHPTGSHDHGFYMDSGGGLIGYRGKACWEQGEKCAYSQEHRTWMMTTMPWVWTPEIEAAIDPANCSQCPYFLRSQPWAHLRHQSAFNRIFPASFGVQGSLNKVTPFQLRQLMIEAGLQIAAEQRSYVTNDPPPELLAPPFALSREDLVTWMFRLSARKPAA